MKAEWSNKDSLEIPETTAGIGSVSWSDDKEGTSCDIASVRLSILSILPKYDDYIHTVTYRYNQNMEDIYSKGHEDGWNACLRAIEEELEEWGWKNGMSESMSLRVMIDDWEKENETN